MSFIAPIHLDPEDFQVYQNLVDILGPVGKPALDKLCEAIRDKAREEGFEAGHYNVWESME